MPLFPTCVLCEKYRGKKIVHGSEGCKLAESTKCLSCYQYGHLSVNCPSPRIVQRPRTLEECIPADIRLKYGITTSTPIAYASETIAESEIADINNIEVPSDFEGLSKFVRQHGIKVEGKVTKASEKALLQAIRSWAISKGYRIYQVAAIPVISRGQVDGKDTEIPA